MRVRPVLAAAIAVLTLAATCPSASAQYTFKRPIHTRSGIVVVGYAPLTSARIVLYGKKTVWSGSIGNRAVTQIRLKPGTYQFVAADEVRIISQDLAAFLRDAEKPVAPAPAVGSRGAAGSLSVVEVPWPRDASFASDPPSFQSRHVVFAKVATRLKAVIQGGIAPYVVEWDPGDGSGWQVAGTVGDGYTGAAMTHSYDLPIGTPIDATVKVTDANGAGSTVYGKYYIRVGNPGSRADRIARSTDEALWYMHARLTRVDDVVRGTQPAVNIAYPNHDAKVSAAAMFAICLANTGRSITGGRNFSNDPAKDAYVDDLNRLINFLTDEETLPRVAHSGAKTYGNGIGDVDPDSHPAGGNGYLLRSNGISVNYEGGMHLQAICLAGNVDAPVPNRTEYASYYDLIGDFVDGFQYSQATSGWALGGWRYDFSYGDSDGSVVAWVGIGLRAAEEAYRLTPLPSRPPIQILPQVKDALAVWLDFDTAKAGSGSFQNWDYRINAYRNTQLEGGYGYTGPTQWCNAAKTGGGLSGLNLIRKPIDDPLVKATISFLYRVFYQSDNQAGWGSSRDSYGMYNILKGLQEYGITELTDPLATGPNDIDGVPLAPIDWFAVLADFIAGTSDTDLGHQQWPGNPIGAYVSSTPDGHYEPTGVHSGDWGWGSADQNASWYSGPDLITGWDTAILQSTVFEPAPVAVIHRPDDTSGETFVPVQVNGADYQMVCDPAGSYELNPAARIVRVRWEFGDGTSDEYDLASPGEIGGAVPPAPGMRPVGNQTQHHYAALGDYVVKLTVFDDKGQSNSTTLTVHVVPAPYPPTARFTVTSVGTAQEGDTVVINPDGTVTLKMDASASSNPDPASVMAPRNANGISNFAWEWPTNPDTGYNDGRSELPPPGLFDQGEELVSPDLNSGSRDPVQTYTFRFDPERVRNGSLSRITVGVRVTSNITQLNGMPPKTVTLLRQISLVTALTGNKATRVDVSPAIGHVELPVKLEARLVREVGGEPLAARSLAFAIDGAAVGAADTDATGWARLSYEIPGSLSAGGHQLTASFAGDGQLKPSSGSNDLLVRVVPLAVRRLPTAYVPGAPITVTLEVTPPAGAAAWEIAETPPAGWALGANPDGATFTGGVLRWGPVVAGTLKRLTYGLVAPSDAQGSVSFDGIAIVDGQQEPVVGQSVLPMGDASKLHPADKDFNSRIGIVELASYGGAWAKGATWHLGPVPIPIAYVTNAGLIWKQGEVYHHEPGQDPPFVPGIARSRAGRGGTIAAVAKASAFRYVPGRPVEFQIKVTPRGVSSWAIEERVPTGWTVVRTSTGGSVDAAKRVVRWGPYANSTPRTVTYMCVPARATSGSQAFAGTASADGRNAKVTGTRTLRR